ncbi:MAG: PaaI family thioesterase [Mycobacteriales bacterium]
MTDPAIERLRGLMAGGPEQLATRMGIEILDWTPDRMVASMPVAGNRQPYGLLHGGASCVLAETVGSIAAGLAAGADRIAVGVDINATHHRAATGGTVTAVCTPLHVGRSTASFAIEITDDSGRRVCTSRLSCVLRDGVPGP